MRDKFLDFLFLQEPNIQWVVLGCVLMGAACGVVGVYSNLRKQSLVGDAVAHAVLPGVCLAFLWVGDKSWLAMTLGAYLSGFLALYLINLLPKHSKLKEDSVIALVLSVFFGLGVVILSFIQQSGNPNQSGLQGFLLGKAASMLASDVLGFAFLSFMVLGAVVWFFEPFKALCFDRNFSTVMGLPVSFMEFLLVSLTVLAVVSGIQAVGVVLISAMLITPVAAARFWSHNLKVVVLISGLLGAVSGYFGAMVSYLWEGMPTGPWVVVLASGFAFVSFAFAPKRGLIAQKIKQNRHRKTILTENLLKALYQLGEKQSQSIFSTEEVQNQRKFSQAEFKKGIRWLQKQGFVSVGTHGIQLTESGLNRAKTVVRLHRLWELYLSTYLQISREKVHQEAETIEHIITPEIEQLLLKRLDFPEKDPHQTIIPY
jgi:manganese/zinc/iron transport system permease protein